MLDLLQCSNLPERERLLSIVVDRQLSLQDGAVLEIEKIKDDFQQIVATVSQLKQASDQEIAGLRAENQRLTRIPQGTIKKSFLFPTGILVLQLITATIVGCIVSGGIAIYYILPQKIATQRGEDLKTLEFINSDEGKTLKMMLKLNQGYFPDKCQEDARNNGISIVFKGKKEDKVCILRIP